MFKHRQWLDTIKTYKANESGQIAVMFALLAIPLLILVSSVMDYTAAEKERGIISAALDDAALAAVIKQNITDEERKAYAVEYFWQNVDKNKTRELKVIEAKSNRVALVATSSVPTSIISAIGVNNFNVVEESVGELTKGDVICMLVLDPESEASFEVSYGARLQTNNCSVQVNSRHKRAAVVEPGSAAYAKDFCIAGGANGAYTPHVNTECASVEDPYAALKAPTPGACIDQNEIDKKLNNFRSKVYPGVTLSPGTYCGGLHLKANVVTFLPGTYIIKDGPLNFDDGTRVSGDGVTFVLTGKNAVLKKAFGSKIDIVAPAKGKYAGLGFFQDRFNTGQSPAVFPSAESVINEGSSLKLTGTGYFPTQKITIRNGAWSSTQAPATSFITYQMSITEGAYVDISVDHQKAGLPPILPRADEGARLAK